MFNFGTIEPWIDPAFLYRYLIAIHALGCLFLFIQHKFLGLKITDKTARVVKWMIWACLIIPIIQAPISVSRILFSLAPEFSLAKPFDAYLNFLWSPMCTSPLIWALQIYIATQCKCQVVNIKGKKINYIPSWYMVMGALGAGYVLSHGIYSYAINFKVWEPQKFLVITSLLTLVSAMLELLIPSVWKKTINTVSYSIIFFIGTWLYFLNWIPR